MMTLEHIFFFNVLKRDKQRRGEGRGGREGEEQYNREHIMGKGSKFDDTQKSASGKQ